MAEPADEAEVPDLTPNALGERTVYDIFGDLADTVKSLMLPPRNALLQLSAQQQKTKEEQWRIHDFPTLKIAVDSLPDTFNDKDFNKIDFLTRVKRWRGCLTKSVVGVVDHDSKWRTTVATEIRKKYASTELAATSLVAAFEDKLTASRNQAQASWRQNAKKKQEAAKKASEEEEPDYCVCDKEFVFVF